jgi:hypothetical protein
MFLKEKKLMNHDEKIQFGKIFTGLGELYGKKISAIFLAIYWDSLSHYSFNEIQMAVKIHIINPDTGQFMPKPADLIRYIEGSNNAKAFEAWDKVLSAAKRIGAYDSIVFDDPLIHHIISGMGGWVTICHTDESRLPFLCKEFCDRYSACLTRMPKAIPAKLSGIHCFEQPRLISKDTNHD